jgi:hypothetical protein
MGVPGLAGLGGIKTSSRRSYQPADPPPENTLINYIVAGETPPGRVFERRRLAGKESAALID